MSANKPKPDQPVDAFRFPRYLQDGCEHFMGRCKCGVPFWLRPFSPAELVRVERNRLRGEGREDEEVA